MVIINRGRMSSSGPVCASILRVRNSQLPRLISRGVLAESDFGGGDGDFYGFLDFFSLVGKIDLAKRKLKFGQIRSKTYGSAPTPASRLMSQWVSCRIGVGKKRRGHGRKRGRSQERDGR